MCVRGFIVDFIMEKGEAAEDGKIPKSWVKLGKWKVFENHPPDAFGRALVAKSLGKHIVTILKH